MLISDSGRTLLIFNIIFVLLCTLVLILRFWALKIIGRQVCLDDFVILFSYVTVLVFAAIVFWTVPNGIGSHIEELDQNQITVMFKAFAVGSYPWLFATVSVKVSVLLLYIRIFSTRRFKFYAWAVIAISMLYLVAWLPVFATSCVPSSQPWHPVPGGHCRDLLVPMLTSVSICMVLDTIIVCLPMPLLWNLQMKTRNKIVVSLMFGIGFTTVGVMIWRIRMTITSYAATDFSYSLAKVTLISELEVWLGFIAANMPNLAPLATRWSPSIATTLRGFFSSSVVRDPLYRRASRNTDSESSTIVQEAEKRYLNGTKVGGKSQRYYSPSSDGFITTCSSSTDSWDGAGPTNAIVVHREFEVQTLNCDEIQSTTKNPIETPIKAKILAPYFEV